jgi:hypothetical protein
MKLKEKKGETERVRKREIETVRGREEQIMCVFVSERVRE